MDAVYCLPNDLSARFRWACWDSEAVLYNIKSGDTHRALSPAGPILELLNSGLIDLPVSEQQIVDLMIKQGSISPQDTLASLSALCSIGLLKQTTLADC